MTGLLVSVRNAAEARAALAGGATLIDIKEPLRGSLGAASPQQWREVIATCPPQIPVSLALGELLDPDLATRIARVPEVQFAKLGLAGCTKHADWYSRWRYMLAQLPLSTRTVAVSYADWRTARCPHPREVLEAAKQLSCSAMLWDTYDKQSGSLLEHYTVSELADSIGAARDCGMLIVLAGSLTRRDLPRLAPLGIDYVAVRGAVCAGMRTDAIHRQRVAQFAQALSAATVTRRCCPACAKTRAGARGPGSGFSL